MKGPGAVRRGPVLSGYLILVQISDNLRFLIWVREGANHWFWVCLFLLGGGIRSKEPSVRIISKASKNCQAS